MSGNAICSYAISCHFSTARLSWLSGPLLKVYHMLGPRKNLKNSLRCLTSHSPKFYQGWKNSQFLPTHLYVTVILNCSNLSKIWKKLAVHQRLSHILLELGLLQSTPVWGQVPRNLQFSFFISLLGESRQRYIAWKFTKLLTHLTDPSPEFYTDSRSLIIGDTMSLKRFSKEKPP